MKRSGKHEGRRVPSFRQKVQRPLALAVMAMLGGSSLVVPALGMSPVPVSAAGMQWLHAQGNKLVDESGKIVVLRGVNIEHWNWVYPNMSYETRAIPMATGAPPNGWGANIILLAMASGPINRNDPAYLGMVDQMVAMAKANGAYSLLTYRTGEPDGDQPTMPDQAAQDAMAALAARYANEPAVLYGLQVEPHDVSWSALKPRFTSMIDAIRARNPRALIAVPGTDYDRYVHWNLTDPIQRANLMFKIDYYDPFSDFDSAYQLTAVAAQYPVILAEFGTGSQSTQSDIVNLLNRSETLGIGWIAWLFQSQACPCLLTDTTTFATTAYGAEIKRRLQGAAQSPAPAPAPVLPPALIPTPAPVVPPAVIPTPAPVVPPAVIPTPPPVIIPTPTPPAATPPAPPPPPAITPPVSTGAEVVYDDTLRWQNWSWRTSVNPDAISPVFGGAKSLGVTFTSAWAGLSLATPGLDTSPYSSLVFSIRPGGQALSAIEVSLYNTADAAIKQVDPTPYATDAGNGWYRVSIPLAALGGAGVTITRVQLQDATGAAQPAFYIDGLQFAGSGVPTPTPAPVPSSSPASVATLQLVTRVIPVTTSSDDAYAESIRGWPGFSSTDPYVYAGYPGSNGAVVGGWRWTDLGIPRGATIIEAWAELNEEGYGYSIPTTLTLQNSASPATFSSSSTPADRLASSTAFKTSWSWGGAQKPGVWFQTPSLAVGLQELINRYGGLDQLVLLENGIGNPQGQYHNWAAYDSAPSRAARVHLTYSLP